MTYLKNIYPEHFHGMIETFLIKNTAKRNMSSDYNAISASQQSWSFGLAELGNDKGKTDIMKYDMI